MFHFHKCICLKEKEQEIYHTKEVQKLYEMVSNVNASNTFLKQWNYENRKIHKHHACFSMKLSKNAFSLFLVPVVIDNVTYQFIVDTGAQISGVSSGATKLIENSRKGKEVMIRSAAGNMKPLQSIVLDKLFLGTLEIENQPAVILDENDFQIKILKRQLIHFDGIIGWDILSQLDFELDASKYMFSLIDCKENFTYCNMIGAVFPVVIVYDEENRAALFGIDSGASESWISSEYATKTKLKNIKQKRGINIGVHGMETLKVHLYKRLVTKFAKSKIILENVRSGETQVFDGLKLDGIYGNEIFRGKVIQFLNSKGIVRILDEKIERKKR